MATPRATTAEATDKGTQAAGRQDSRARPQKAAPKHNPERTAARRAAWILPVADPTAKAARADKAEKAAFAVILLREATAGVTEEIVGETEETADQAGAADHFAAKSRTK